MQFRFPVAELLERGDSRDHGIAAVAGMPVFLANVVQVLLKRQAARIWRMAAIDHVAERRYDAFRVGLEPHLPNELAVHHGDLLAAAQIGDGFRALVGGYAERDA